MLSHALTPMLWFHERFFPGRFAVGLAVGGGHRGIVYSTKQWHLWHENGSGDVMILWFLLQRGSSTEGSCTIRYNKWKLFYSLWN